MGLHKGVTNNPKGRPQGKPNKSTEEIKQLIINFISHNIDNIQVEFDKLEAKEKLLFIEKLFKHVIPASFDAKSLEALPVFTVVLPEKDLSQER